VVAAAEPPAAADAAADADEVATVGWGPVRAALDRKAEAEEVVVVVEDEVKDNEWTVRDGATWDTRKGLLNCAMDTGILTVFAHGLRGNTKSTPPDAASKAT
jgi:hypothetical protein